MSLYSCASYLVGFGACWTKVNSRGGTRLVTTLSRNIFVSIIFKGKQPWATQSFIASLLDLDCSVLQTSLYNKAQLVILSLFEACFRRQTFYVPNRMQMNLNKDFSSLPLGSAHEKFDVWNGPEQSHSILKTLRQYLAAFDKYPVKNFYSVVYPPHKTFQFFSRKHFVLFNFCP